MARMYPERLPSDVVSDAERRLFDLFSTEFGNDFVVFHGVRWLARQRDRDSARDGEVDFIVAHPRYGVLVLEVKGGGIGYDAATGEYTSSDRHGSVHHIKDPFKQSVDSCYALVRKLKDADTTRGYKYKVGHAVALPDVHVDEIPGFDKEPATIIDADGIRNLKQAVIDAFRFYGMGKEPMGEQALEALVGLVGRSWQIERPLGTELADEERQMRLLTEQQFMALDLLSTRRRVLISGCAGSGKTMLALEKARRLANDGFEVLLTCYNTSLETWLKTQMDHPKITVQRFLSLCATWAKRAEVDLIDAPGEDFYAQLPDALLRATETIPTRFDAIIVDEGQDFSADMWVALTSLLRDEDDGILYIFYDDNQNLYGGSTFPITDPPFPLTQNCRNTQLIHEAVVMFYRSQTDALPQCIGPKGRPTHALKVPEGSSEKGCVEEFITGLVTEGQVKAGDIAVLTRPGKDKSKWSPPPHHSRWEATWELDDCAGKVIVSSIHGFKGLERPVVIVCELQGLNAAKDVELLYVAFSRARDYLVVAGADALVG